MLGLAPYSLRPGFLPIAPRETSRRRRRILAYRRFLSTTSRFRGKSHSQRRASKPFCSPPPIFSCLRNGRRLKIQKARGSLYPRNGKPIMPQETGRFASRKWETVRPNPPGIPPSFGPLHSNPPDIPPSHGSLQHPARRQAAPTLLRTWLADSLPDFPRPGFSQKPHRLDCRIRLAADRLLRRASGRSEQAGTSR